MFPTKFFGFHTASNYSGTKAALRGCLNDWRDCLSVLDDWAKISQIDRESYIGENYQKDLVVNQARKLPARLKQGEALIYTNSSHGTPIRDSDGDEVDGFDEALYTNDGKFISDDEIHRLLMKFSAGTLIIGLFDNCHAGTMDRSLNVKNYHSIPKDVLCHSVLYFGCREEGTSADAFIGGKYRGAFTFCLLSILVETKYEVTYLELLNKTNERLKKLGFEQVAQMACSPGMENLKFGEMPN